MLYGITMDEPGISRTVSVVMGSVDERREISQTLPEQMAARHRGIRAPAGVASTIEA